VTADYWFNKLFSQVVFCLIHASCFSTVKLSVWSIKVFGLQLRMKDQGSELSVF